MFILEFVFCICLLYISIIEYFIVHTSINFLLVSDAIQSSDCNVAILTNYLSSIIHLSMYLIFINVPRDITPKPKSPNICKHCVGS